MNDAIAHELLTIPALGVAAIRIRLTADNEREKHIVTMVAHCPINRKVTLGRIEIDDLNDWDSEVRLPIDTLEVKVYVLNKTDSVGVSWNTTRFQKAKD